MKKIIFAIVAFAALCACSGEKKDLSYRGLSMGLPFQTFCDSMQARGFYVDSAKSDSATGLVVMANPSTNYRISIAQKEGQLVALQENYKISTNDSTRKLWQQMRDQFEKELGSWPNMPKHGDDHKVAKFETDGGFITLTVENTYKPTFAVRYDRK